MERIGQHAGALPSGPYTRRGSYAACRHVWHESKRCVWAVSGNQEKEHKQKSKKGPGPNKNLLHKQDKTNFLSRSLSETDPTTLAEGKAKGKLAYPRATKSQSLQERSSSSLSCPNVVLKFQFSATLGTKMDHKSRRSSGGDSKNSDSRKTGKSDLCDGMVQC
ncbi:hypothetical protein SO802_024928 [Lithocarpus litseifolius]|uniref:Uncharacterized protein n=1 Tax=Lithocarpus litseifolius TaxID=425828 RepID=A0AAW2CAC3_9ROSI